MDEILDLVDEFDRVIDTCLRSVVYEKGLKNFRVINGFLKNAQGQLWVPRRTAHKKLFPGHLDVSVGGHVQSGESYEDAFMRELSEELNMQAHDHVVREIGYFNPNKQNVSAFMKVYEISTDESPVFNQDDFIEAEWLLPSTIIERIGAGQKAKDDLPRLIKLAYLI